MNHARTSELIKLYQHHLFNDIIPFWLKHSLDKAYGGFLHCLDREGKPYSTDKAIWIQCRAVWMFSKLYNSVEQYDQWFEAAKHGYAFIRKHAFDADGRMFFAVTREGKPLRKRRYLYSEAFGVIALAEYAKASGDAEELERAIELYKLMLHYYRTPGLLEPKILPTTRGMKSHAMPMILIATTQELRTQFRDPLCEEVVTNSLEQILTQHLHRDVKALLETVAPDGGRLDLPAGRVMNPGHAIESAWFIMHEGMHRKDSKLIQQACEIIDWSLELGWDEEYGGLFSFIDVEKKPCEQLEWDMKMWWTHTEALYALLLAHHLTGEEKYLEWYEIMHEYTFTHFPDPQFGEWYGYLHRDGSVANSLKGSMWKGPFHIPRAMLYCWQLLIEMEKSAK